MCFQNMFTLLNVFVILFISLCTAVQRLNGRRLCHWLECYLIKNQHTLLRLNYTLKVVVSTYITCSLHHILIGFSCFPASIATTANISHPKRAWKKRPMPRWLFKLSALTPFCRACCSSTNENRESEVKPNAFFLLTFGKARPGTLHSFIPRTRDRFFHNPLQLDETDRRQYWH